MFPIIIHTIIGRKFQINLLTITLFSQNAVDYGVN